MSQRTSTATIVKILLPKLISIGSEPMRSRWFVLYLKFWKLWPSLLSVTPHIFASHLVALTQLWATNRGSKIFSNNFSIFFLLNPECERIPWLFALKDFPNWKFSGAERFTNKFPISLISLSVPKKKSMGSCSHNFDATHLPNSLFEPSYPKVFRGA